MLRYSVPFYVAALLIFFCGQAIPMEKRCDLCHVGHMGTSALLNKDINELCSSCHIERVAQGEHKVGMSPPMVVRELPLYSGKMTCVTCHDPHAKSPLMLRKPAAELCILCHAK